MGWLAAAAISAFVSFATWGINALIQQDETSKQKELAEKQISTEKEIADNNFGLSKEQFEYQKQLNELQMKREDTAMQRQVADLKAAGLSPLMASGGSSTGQLISAPAAQYNSSGIQSAMSNLLGVYKDSASRKMQAYQFERQQSIQNAQNLADLYSTKLSNQYQKEQIRAQRIANDYNEKHGLRDPNPVNALTDFVQEYFEDRYPNMQDFSEDMTTKKEQLKDKLNAAVDKAAENSIKSKNMLLDATVGTIKKDVEITKRAGKNVGSKIKSGAKKIGSGIKSTGRKVVNIYHKIRGK